MMRFCSTISLLRVTFFLIVCGMGWSTTAWPQASHLEPIKNALLNEQFSEAEDLLQGELKKTPDDLSLQSLQATLLVLTGKSDQALALWKSIADASESPLEALVQYGQELQRRGRSEQAFLLFEKALRQWENSSRMFSEDVTQVALAHWGMGDFQEANHWFREATRLDSKNWQAQQLWGELFLEKYNEPEAQKSFNTILQQNDQYLPALIGLSKTLSGAGARPILEEVLLFNEHSISALTTLARFQIEQGQFKEAQIQLTRALNVNPQSIEALTLSAAIAHLKEDQVQYKQIEERVKKLNPTPSQFYSQLAEISGRLYQFSESVTLGRESVQVDPNDGNAHTVLGMNLLRLGSEEEGRKHLEIGFEKDPFNLWTDNMLKVLDVLDTYEVRKTEHFVVKLSPRDAQVLWPYLEPFLEETWTTFTKKYDYTPETPILLEIFEKHEDFSVRTSGMPSIGPLVGVCFGRVITLDSPLALRSITTANWKEILWHEFGHVVTLGMSRNRMPRWLSEGVSVYEEHQGQPEWGREQSLDLVRAHQNNKILSMSELVSSFANAGSSEDLHMAYFQSYLVVAYIVEHYGFESLKSLIAHYGQIRPMETIFEDVFKQSLTTFEEGFEQWIEAEVNQINLYVHQNDPSDQGEAHGHGMRENVTERLSERMSSTYLKQQMQERIDAEPRDFMAHLQMGVLLFREKQETEAIPFLRKAQKILPTYGASPNPHQLLAEIYRRQGKRAAYLEELKDLLVFQQHDYASAQILAKAASQQGKVKEALYYLERALAVDPYPEALHQHWADLAMQSKDYTTAIRELKILLTLDSTDPVEAHTNLAHAYWLLGAVKEAKVHALNALEIAPTYDRAQEILLAALGL